MTVLQERIQLKHFNKGDHILSAHQVCKESYFVQSGILRLYFLKDGKEISEFFSSSGEWVNSPKSFMTQQNDIYYLDVIEDSTVFSLNVQDLLFLFDNYPEMERYARLSMGSVFHHMMERIVSMRFTSAKEKYAHFKEIYKHIHHRIPLGMIATYLGITQETLSRIRAEK